MARPKLSGKGRGGGAARPRPRNVPQQPSLPQTPSPPRSVRADSYPPAPGDMLDPEPLPDGGAIDWTAQLSRHDPNDQPLPRYGHSHDSALQRYDSPHSSIRSGSSSARHRLSPPYNGSEATLVAPSDEVSLLQMGDSASNYYGDNEKLGPVASSASFLAVPELRQRQASSVMPAGPGGFIGGFGYPTGRYSSAMSVASSDREATSEAWIKRQRIKPGRAKTKKVKLTKGRFITEFGMTPLRFFSGIRLTSFAQTYLLL